MKHHFRAEHLKEFVTQKEARGRPGRGEQIRQGKRFVPGVIRGGPPASLSDFIAGIETVLPPAAAGAAELRLTACGALLSGVAVVAARGQQHEVPFEIAHSHGATLANIVRATATIEGGRDAQELRVGGTAGFTVTFKPAAGSRKSTVELVVELHNEILHAMRARASSAVWALRAGEADGALRIARDASLARVAGCRDLHRATTNDVFLMWISCLALAAKAVAAATQLGAGEEEDEEEGGGGEFGDGDEGELLTESERCAAALMATDEAVGECEGLFETARTVRAYHWNPKACLSLSLSFLLSLSLSFSSTLSLSFSLVLSLSLSSLSFSLSLFLSLSLLAFCTSKSRPESGPDCLKYAILSRAQP